MGPPQVAPTGRCHPRASVEAPFGARGGSVVRILTSGDGSTTDIITGSIIGVGAISVCLPFAGGRRDASFGRGYSRYRSWLCSQPPHGWRCPADESSKIQSPLGTYARLARGAEHRLRGRRGRAHGAASGSARARGLRKRGRQSLCRGSAWRRRAHTILIRCQCSSCHAPRNSKRSSTASRPISVTHRTPRARGEVSGGCSSKRPVGSLWLPTQTHPHHGGSDEHSQEFPDHAAESSRDCPPCRGAGAARSRLALLFLR